MKGNGEDASTKTRRRKEGVKISKEGGSREVHEGDETSAKGLKERKQAQIS